MNNMNEIKKQRFSANLNRLLEDRLMSQTELAERMKLQRSVVNSWTQGNAIPRKNRIITLAQILGVEPDELIYGSRDERTQEIVEKINSLNNEDRDFILKIIDNLSDK